MTKNLELAKTLFLRGIEAMNKNYLLEAKDLFEQSLKIIPDRPSTLTNLSAVLIQLEMFQEALKISIKSVEEDSNNIDGMVNIGLSYLKLKLSDKALQQFDNVLSIDSQNIIALNNKAVALYEMRKFQQADHVLNHLLSIDPFNAEAFVNKANIS